MRLCRGNIDAVGVVVAAELVADGDDRASAFVQKPRRRRADLSEALNCDPKAVEPSSFCSVHVATEHVHDASPGRLFSATTAADADGFTGDHAQLLMADDARIGVGNPGHLLTGRPQVWSRNVPIRPDDVMDLVREAPDEILSLGIGEFLGVANDAALGTAVGQVDECVFPGLKHGQCHDLVAGDVRAHAEPAFVGAEHVGVLHSEAREDLDAAVVHADGATDGRDAFGARQHLSPRLVEMHPRIDAIEVAVGVLPERGRRLFSGAKQVGVGDHPPITTRGDVFATF